MGPMVDRSYLRTLSSLFSPPAIRAMAGKDQPATMRCLVSESGLSEVLPRKPSNGNVLEAIYDLLVRHYRCEYVYKNSIAKNILVGRHRLAGSTMATELRCDTSKADFVILNGTSTVYEIKTELDNLDRLPGQLQSYRRMFDKIMVVAPHNLAQELVEGLDGDIGVLAMTARGTLRQLRPSKSHLDGCDPGCIFDSLRKSEYIPIVERHFGRLPSLPNTQHYSYCRELFLKLPSGTAHQEMVTALKDRFRPPVDLEFLKLIPTALIAGLLGSQINEKQALSLAEFMELQYAPQ